MTEISQGSRVEAFFILKGGLLPPSSPSSLLPSLHQSIPPPSLSWEKMSLKTQTARGLNMKGEWSATEGAEQCPSSFFFFFRAANSCQDQWPRYRGRPKESTIAAPEATGHGLVQTHSSYWLSVGQKHARVQTAVCGWRRTRFGLMKCEQSETSVSFFFF